MPNRYHQRVATENECPDDGIFGRTDSGKDQQLTAEAGLVVQALLYDHAQILDVEAAFLTGLGCLRY